MSGTAQTRSGKPGLGRRRLWVGLALLTVTLGLLGWRFWPRSAGERRAAIPEIPLDDAEPVVRRMVEEMRGKVLREPGSAQAWGRLAQVLLANGYDRQAFPCLEEAERLEPSNPRWPYLRAVRLILEDRDRALPPLRRAVHLCEQAGSSNTTPRLVLVDALVEKGEFDEAEQELQRVLDREPDNARAYFDRGLIALQRDDLVGAEDSFRRASDSPFSRQKACAQLAAVCQRRGKAKEAAEYARKAAELPADLVWADPYVAEYEQWAVGRQARFLEAEQMEREGRVAEQIRLLCQVVEDFPDDRSQAALGVALAKVKDYDKAEQPLRVAIRLAPDKLANYFALSVVLLRQGESRKQRGDEQGARSKFREAAEWARKTIERKPDHAMAHIYLGLALEQLGQRREAIDSFQTAVRCRPELVDTHLHLGEALAEDGQTAQARAALETAAGLAGNGDDRARTALARLRGREQRPK